MKKLTKYHKRVRLTYAAAAFVCCFVLLLIFNSVGGFASEANFYIVKVGDKIVGTINSKEKAEQALATARARISTEAESIVYVDSNFSIEKDPRLFGETDDYDSLVENVYSEIKEYTDNNYTQAIMLSSNDFSISVDSAETARQILESAEREYDTKAEWDISIVSNQNEQFTEFSYTIEDSEEMEEAIFNYMVEHEVSRTEASINVHEFVSVGFSDALEIRPIYTDRSAIQTGDAAIKKALNENKGNIGVLVVKRSNYDEEYDAPPQYVEDTSMYAGQTETIDPGERGQRNVTVDISYINGKETKRDIVFQTVFKEPVAAILKAGTIPAPTFVQPVTNCYLSSGYGYRWGTIHQGNDYAASMGEPIFASCPGVVVEVIHSDVGYGNNVIIKHDDHFTTRYAHMSETACEVGQEVKQFEVIGYVGSTGNSTGPHCHFEIMVDGVQHDPFEFLEGEGYDWYPDEW